MTRHYAHRAKIRVAVEVMLFENYGFTLGGISYSARVSQVQIRPKLVSQSEDRPSEFPLHAPPALAIREHLATTAATTDVRGPCRTGIF